MQNNELNFYLLWLAHTKGMTSLRLSFILEYIKAHDNNVKKVIEDEHLLKNILETSQIDSFYRNESKVLSEWKKLIKEGVLLINMFDRNYPKALQEHLGKKAPPLLTALGNPDLLSKVSVGFCGSRKASEKGLETALDCVEQLVSKGINIVSGYASGIDMITHKTALSTGGSTTIVLPEGIFNFNIRREIKNVWDWNRVLILSEFAPSAGWQMHNAMQRNKTICALSNAMILIEAKEKGGSIEAGQECIKMRIPLFAAIYEGMPEWANGNDILIKQGAIALKKNIKSNRANLESIFSVLINKNQGLSTSFSDSNSVQNMYSSQKTIFQCLKK